MGRRARRGPRRVAARHPPGAPDGESSNRPHHAGRPSMVGLSLGPLRRTWWGGPRPREELEGRVEKAALRIDDLTVRFGGLVALDGVSLSVDPGEVVGVIGPNGAGKTTLFNVVCGFVRPTSGTLQVRGNAQRRIRPHQLAGLGIARTLQGLGLFP